MDDIGDVGPRQREVLEGAGHAAIPRGILEGRSISARRFGLRISRRRGSLAVRHASALEDVVGVRSLGEDEAICVPLNVDAEEVADWPHVFHGEGGLEAGDEMAKKCSSGCREDHVVHIKQQVRHVVAVLVHEQGGVRA